MSRLSARRTGIRVAFFAALCCLPANSDAGVPSAPDPRRPAAIQVEHVPPIPAELAERLRQYQSTRDAAFHGWSPDGKGILIGTRFGNTVQLHRVFEPGGRREQVTFFDEPVGGRFLPRTTDGTLLLTTNSGGNENFQALRFDRATGRAMLLTDGKSRNLLDAVAHDGSRMVIASNRRNGRDMDLYLGTPAGADSFEALMPVENESWSVADWSHDGKTLLLNRYVSINESHPALFDIAIRKRTPIPIPGGKAAFGPMKFAPDGKAAYIVSDAEGEFRRLARVDLKSFEFAWLTGKIAWDVEDVQVEDKSGRVAFTVNAGGASELYLLDGDAPRRLAVPVGVIGGLEFSPDGRSLGFTLSQGNAPADAYSLLLDGAKLTRWTYSEVGGLDASRFVAPTQIAFPTFDKRMVPAWYSRPKTASREKPAAVLINIHGGPENQSRPIFSGFDQFFLNELGIAVIKPNVRGSSGYGKVYVALDNAEKREDSVKDIGALLDWVSQQPELDASRVAVIGGSYGGYMVLSTLMHYSDRLKAGVDLVGIASFQSFLKTTSAYRRDLRRAEYGDERDPAMQKVFARIDPLNHAEKITAALMVIHGRNDPRVPFTEAGQIAAKVRGTGREVWTVYADNEGHGFLKKDNRDYQTAAIVLFLEHHLTRP